MIGERIGNFRIVSQLGIGGMGEVFLAEHEKIGTKVAIKMLQPHISANTEHVQRFFNEAIAASKIQHAGIGKIFDVGFHERGRAYLVMEFLDGETLAARIRRLGRLTLQQTSDIGKQITSVLEAVHKAGITHRDLKPDNIFLVPDQELGERVKVLDFGIAKLSGHSGGLTATAAGSMGTPAYMSPEQWKNSKNVDWRADAYSLGCVAFEMVAGRPPFVAETIGEACAKHLTEEPPRLSSLVATPAPLDNLIASLLAKHPEQRPSTMRDIGNAFSALATANQLGLAATLPPPSSYGAGMSAPIPMLVPRTVAVSAHAPNTTLGAAAASAPVAKPTGNRTLLFVVLVALGGLGLIGAMVALVMSSTEDTRAAAVAAREEVAREQARAVEEALAEARKRDVVATPMVTLDAGPVEAPDGADNVVTGQKDRRRPSVTGGRVADASSGAPGAKPSPGRCDEVSCVLNNYEGACCLKFRKGKTPGAQVGGQPANASSDLPDALDRAMISSGIATVKSHLGLCAALAEESGSPHGKVKATVKVSPDGSVARVDTRTEPENSSLGDCVRRGIEKVRFAKTQAGGSFTYPFVF